MWWQPGCQLHNSVWTDFQKPYLHTKVVGDFLSQISIFQRIFNRQKVVVGCKVEPLSCQGCCQLSTVSIPVHFDHFEALNHHFIDEPHGGNLIKADRGYHRWVRKITMIFSSPHNLGFCHYYLGFYHYYLTAASDVCSAIYYLGLALSSWIEFCSTSSSFCWFGSISLLRPELSDSSVLSFSCWSGLVAPPRLKFLVCWFCLPFILHNQSINLRVKNHWSSWSASK